MDAELYEALDQLDDTWWWFVGRRRVIREVLRRHLPPTGAARQILDLGCGSGGNLVMLREFGEVVGLDSSERALQGARLRVGPATVLIHGEFPSSLSAAARFDVICALDVLEHLDDPISTLRAARERLRPGGRLVVTVPAFPFLWSAHDEANHHRRRYVRHTLLAELSQGGFAADWVSHYNSVLFPLIAAARLVQHVLPVGRSESDAVPPPAPVNALLAKLFGAEGRVVPHLRLPFGVSLIAVARAS